MRHVTLYLQIFGAAAVLLTALPAGAQSFRVQCPNGTTLHPSADPNQKHSKVDSMVAGDSSRPDSKYDPPQIKCQHISGGDGFATMADGQQIYLFGFGPLSVLSDIAKGLPGTQPAATFNGDFVGPTFPGDGTAPNNAGIMEPALMMNNGVLAARAPAPVIAMGGGHEFFPPVSNLRMIIGPDLFEQHPVDLHGYPNAS